MNIKQKNKKQNCVTIGVYLLIHLLQEFYLILRCYEGLVMEAEKQKKKQESIKNKEKEIQKRVLGKLNGTRSITFSDLFNCLI
jgi:hypothetical protein